MTPPGVPAMTQNFFPVFEDPNTRITAKKKNSPNVPKSTKNRKDQP
jgi:hypothetical protein